MIDFLNFYHKYMKIQIDVAGKLFDPDQWNFYTKNVKHSTSEKKSFQMIKMISVLFVAFDLEDPVLAFQNFFQIWITIFRSWMGSFSENVVDVKHPA